MRKKKKCYFLRRIHQSGGELKVEPENVTAASAWEIARQAGRHEKT